MKLALIGCGGVGQAFLEILRGGRRELQERYGLDVTVVAVSDPVKGSVAHADGLDLQAMQAALAAEGTLAAYRGQAGVVHGWDSLSTIRESGAEVVVEATPTTASGEPATTHCRAALSRGCHVITSNKGPLVHAYTELMELAAARGVHLGIEGTVMSGTPSLRLAREALAGAGICGVRGVLNGTTNYMLTQMEAGQPYAEALAEAQAAGYAEADPTGDVEGFDAAYKLMILSRHVLHMPVELEDIAREGITHLTPAAMAAEKSGGAHWRLVAQLARRGAGYVASVRPEVLPAADPLAAVGGVTNAITYETELLGPVTLLGPGAGRRETGYALLRDVLDLARPLGERTAARSAAARAVPSGRGVPDGGWTAWRRR